jgi:hypothetical protein
MTNKPASRNWNDVQVTIATISMAFTLIFWNLFAGPDHAAALKRAQEQAARDQAERDRIAQEQAAQAAAQPQAQIQPAAPQAVVQPTPMSGPILLGGSAPQTRVFVGGGGGGGGSGGGGGGGTGGS